MRSANCLTALFVLAFFGIAAHVVVNGQTRSNSTGTGGVNQIRGRIYLPNGKSLDDSISVELQSTTFGSLTVQTDRSGSFAFSGLNPGTYAVIVNVGDSFEIVREYVTIDPEVQTSTIRVPSIPKTFTVPIYLQRKRGVALRNEVIQAKWSAIPKAAIEKVKHGMELQQEGKNAEAEAEFRKSIELSPAFAPAHTALGKLILQSGKPEAALEHFRAAIRYDDSDFDAHLNLGIAYLNLKKYDQAEPELVTAAYLNRYAVTPHYYLGMVFVMKNDLTIAQKAFETAKDLNGGKSLPNIHKYLGRIYMKKDMEKEALRELETYLKLAPKAPDADKVRKDISDLKAKHLKNDFV